MMDLSGNANTAWAKTFVDELAAAGLQAVCIAPGSRSTPLALAFSVQPAIRVYRHLDERSAGFFALGVAMATRRPVALVCTSGTAAANFHPAIIEAYYARVPLLVLTADRPPELRESGANQTIDQIKMFGDHVLWAVDAPVPQADAPDVVLRHLRSLAARVMATADGLTKGPVHVNLPFRKPLEPERPESAYEGILGNPVTAHTRFHRGRLLPLPADVVGFADAMVREPSGVIVCGPDRPAPGFAQAVSALAQATGYPVLADPLSGLRFGPAVADAAILGGYDWWLPTLPESQLPRVVLRFGSVPTSSAVGTFLARARPHLNLLVREDGQWADDHHGLTDLWQVEPTAAAHALTNAVQARGGELSHRPSCWPALEAVTWEAVRAVGDAYPFFDGMAVAALMARLPEDAILFAGNSLAVRHVEQFGRPDGRSLALFGNRGASGIDGNVSTALGLAAGSGRHVFALLGDITFYHDMNGLLALKHLGLRATFVVLNNDGGGIFHRLPVARHEPPFTDLFLTPHGLTFEHAAAQYGLDYYQVGDVGSLAQALEDTKQNGPGGNLIEVRTESRRDDEIYRRLKAEVQRHIRAVLDS